MASSAPSGSAGPAVPAPLIGIRSGILIVLLISLLAWAPVLYPGFFQSHSGLGAAYDILAAQQVRPLGWLPINGTPGDGPLAIWLASLAAAALGTLPALKALYAASFVLSGLGMFLLARRLLGSAAGVLAAAVYMLLPYQLMTVYVRGAPTEAFLLALAPFLVLAVAGLQRAQPLSWLAAAGMVLLVLLDSPGLGLLLLIIAVIVAAFARREEQVQSRREALPRLPLALALLAGALATLLLLAPFGARLLPRLPGYADHFTYFFQLFAPGWGSGASVPGWGDTLPLQLGIVPFALAVLAVWLQGAGAGRRRTVYALAALAGLLIFLSLNVALFVWQIVPLSALAAYPWQLLGLAGFLLALLAGAALPVLAGDRAGEGQEPPYLLLAVLVTAAVLASYNYLSPRFVDQADLPDTSHPPLARLGDNIYLLDARLPATARPGDKLPVTLIWQAANAPGQDYTVFTHLLDAGGATQSQKDARPKDGARPTNSWQPGEIVRDDIVLDVAPTVPAGTYHLAVGMYQLQSLQRLPLAGAGGTEIMLGPIIVQP